MGSVGSMADDVVGKALEPSTGCLLKAVEGFVEPTYKFGTRRIYKAYRLMAITSFLQRTMEKRVFDIELVNRTVTGHSKAENWMDGGRFDDR